MLRLPYLAHAARADAFDQFVAAQLPGLLDLPRQVVHRLGDDQRHHADDQRRQQEDQVGLDRRRRQVEPAHPEEQHQGRQDRQEQPPRDRPAPLDRHHQRNHQQPDAHPRDAEIVLAPHPPLRADLGGRDHDHHRDHVADAVGQTETEGETLDPGKDEGQRGHAQREDHQGPGDLLVGRFEARQQPLDHDQQQELEKQRQDHAPGQQAHAVQGQGQVRAVSGETARIAAAGQVPVEADSPGLRHPTSASSTGMRRSGPTCRPSGSGSPRPRGHPRCSRSSRPACRGPPSSAPSCGRVPDARGRPASRS